MHAAPEQLIVQLADQLGVKIFRAKEYDNDKHISTDSYSDVLPLVNKVVKHAERWCENGKGDMTINISRVRRPEEIPFMEKGYKRLKAVFGWN